MSYRDGEAAVLLETVARARRSSNGWGRAPCPYCLMRKGRPDRKASFSIMAGSGFYRCMACHVEGFLRDLPPAIERDAPSRRDPEVKVVRPPEGYYPLSFGPGETALALKPARDYLDGRGLDRGLWGPARIGACAA